ncbi:MAG: alpha-amylase [Culicoidibacterales bacterium]
MAHINSKLQRVYDGLIAQSKQKAPAFVPNYWLLHRLPLQTAQEIEIDLYDELIQYISTLLTEADPNTDFTQPLSQITEESDWLKKASVYSAMIRTSASWDHNHDGTLDKVAHSPITETGTFLKTLLLLPLLQYIGINTLYLLPINKMSTLDKKGDFGSPYAVSNFFKLDETLKDSLTGKTTTVEDEFGALCEAAHILGIRIVIDFVPRTNALDSDFILNHPDWFYWIDVNEADGYFPPAVPELFNVEPGETVHTPTNSNLPYVYAEEQVKKHIQKFRFAPNVTDAKRWKEFRKAYFKKPKQNIIKAIEQEFGVTVAKAFSDGINDPQPPWSDVTFFRMYLDHTEESKKYLENLDTPPYILFDIIKSNMHKGNIPNSGLWRKLADIAPHFQREFGIDGARIDMGHALPSELVSMILENAREIDPHFVFIAEELHAKNAQPAKEAGYDMIIGDNFINLPRISLSEKTNYYNDNAALPIPVFACVETHDTPRVAGRFGNDYENKMMSRLISTLNMFSPNAIPFINSGQELFEPQPMNTGLDSHPGDEFKYLPTNDPYYGKLALFDKYALHWLNETSSENIKLYHELARIRSTYIDTLSDVHQYRYSHLDFLPQRFVEMTYELKTPSEFTHIAIFANVSLYDHVDFPLLHTSEAMTILSSATPNHTQPFDGYHGKMIHVAPLEAKVVLLKK